MEKHRHFKLWMLSMAGALCITSAWAQESYSDDELNTKLLIFTDEVDEFLERAWTAYEKGSSLSPQELEKEIEALIQNTHRISAAYFEALDTAVQPDMEAYLNRTYSQNNEIHHYFLLLGNAVYQRADFLVQERIQSNRKMRMWGTVGGTVLGLATGGAILYFKPQLAPNAIHATLLVLGLGAAGAGVGYGGAYLTHTFILPANLAVKNAKDFLAKYPTGDDFVRHIGDASADLALGLLDLEEALHATGSN